MDKVIAQKLREKELEILKARSYQSLCELIGKPLSRIAVGPDGKDYNVEIQVFWDEKPSGNVRVIVNVDDGGWRAFFPKSDSFIMSPNSEIVGD